MLNNKQEDRDESEVQFVKEDNIEEIKNKIRNLLFYKIEMPTNSSSKSIFANLEIICSKLDEVKNCNVYLVYTL